MSHCNTLWITETSLRPAGIGCLKLGSFPAKILIGTPGLAPAYLRPESKVTIQVGSSLPGHGDAPPVPETLLEPR